MGHEAKSEVAQELWRHRPPLLKFTTAEVKDATKSLLPKAVAPQALQLTGAMGQHLLNQLKLMVAEVTGAKKNSVPQAESLQVPRLTDATEASSS